LQERRLVQVELVVLAQDRANVVAQFVQAGQANDGIHDWLSTS